MRGRILHRLLMTVLALVALGLVSLGCRGSISDKPPVHPNWNMDQQARIDPQEPSDFFADGRGMRPPVDGTVARGTLELDSYLYEGKVGDDFVTELPTNMELTMDLLTRGKQRFEIYCIPCHDASGSGKGIVVQRGMLPPMPYSDARLTAMPIGQIYNIVKHGVRNMPAYGKQIPLEDRWAIAAYVRTLQRALTSAPPVEEKTEEKTAEAEEAAAATPAPEATPEATPEAAEESTGDDSAKDSAADTAGESAETPSSDDAAASAAEAAAEEAAASDEEHASTEDESTKAHSAD